MSGTRSTLPKQSVQSAVTLFLAEWAALLLAGADRLPAAADASELGQVADSITP
jgi:hypothetical protein